MNYAFTVVSRLLVFSPPVQPFLMVYSFSIYCALLYGVMGRMKSCSAVSIVKFIGQRSYLVQSFLYLIVGYADQ